MRRRTWCAAIGLFSLGSCLAAPDEPAPVERVEIAPSRLDLALGDTGRLAAHAATATGPADDPIHWSSSNPSVVLVDSTGLVRALGVGAATVIAESGARSATAQISVTFAVTAVAAGFTHSCVLTERKQAACWGSNGLGKLGTGTVHPSSTPSLVLTPASFTALAVGVTQTCALADDGTVYCWGANYSGQLGAGSDDGAPHVLPVAVPLPVSLVQLVAGARHLCGLDAGGVAYCWGGNSWGQIGVGTSPAQCRAANEPCAPVPTPVATTLRFGQLTAGQEHTCGVTLAGEAYCWGFNLAGTLGDSTEESRRDTAVAVSGGLRFASLAAGTAHTCGLTFEGKAYCWGQNDGRLGNGLTQRANFPVEVSGNLRFASLVAGGRHTCALTDTGEAYCWGTGASGQLGTGTRTNSLIPTPVAGGLRFSSLTAGFAHTCGVATDGVGYCWGENTGGELAVGQAGDALMPTPIAGQHLPALAPPPQKG